MDEQTNEQMDERDDGAIGGGGLVPHALAVKVVDAEQRIIEGYAATWDEDFEGETFDPSAFDSGLERFMKRPVLLYQHGRNPDFGINPIGQILKARVDEVGLWVQAQIYKGDRLADRVWNLVKQGVRHFSVGALQRAVRKIGSRIMEWKLAEISVEPFAANPSARFEIVKSLELEYAKALGFDVEAEDAEQEPAEVAQPPIEATETDEATNVADTKGVTLADSQQPQTTEAIPMSEETKAPAVETPNIEEMVGKAVAKALADAEDARTKRETAALAEKERIDALIAKGIEEGMAAKVVNRKIRFSTDDGVEVKSIGDMYGPYDGVPSFDMALGHEVMKAAGQPISEQYLRGMTGKAVNELRKGQLLTKSTDECFFRSSEDQQLARMLTKADELMGSDVASAGNDWVPVYYSRELFPLIRNEAKVLNLFRQVEVVGETLTFPLQTGAATWYKTAQMDDAVDMSWNTATNTSRVAKVATSNMSLTPSKLSALSAWTGELDEQSLVPMLPFLRQEFVNSGRDVMDELLISGDVQTSNANISDNGNGSISTSWRILTLDGLRKEPIITTAANSRDGGTLTAEDFLLTKKLMGTAGAYALDPGKLVWIIDPGLYWKLQSLGEALTLDKFGPGFTFGSGVIERIFGSPVIVSDQYGLTDTAGKIHTTVGNNVKGSFMCVRPDQMLVGFGRRLKIEVERKAMADAWYIVAHMSLAFDMATAEACALTYHVTVT